MRATDVLLGLCLFAVYCLVLFTDHLFRPMPPDCATCGNEMFRTTALCATCHAHHLQCWECSCGVVIADKCRAHSRGPAQRIAGASDFLTKTLPTPQASLLAIIVFIGATRNPKTPRNLTPHPLWIVQEITSPASFCASSQIAATSRLVFALACHSSGQERPESPGPVLRVQGGKCASQKSFRTRRV